MKLYFLIFLIILLPNIYGYGIASRYLPNRTMNLMPGDIREYTVELQNNDPYEVKFDFVLEDSGIASVKDKQEYYLVGGDNKIVPITILINISKNIKETEHIIRYSAIPLTETGGQIGLNLIVNDQFKVIITKPKPDYKIFKTFIILILIIIMSTLLFRKNKQLLRRWKKR